MGLPRVRDDWVTLILLHFLQQQDGWGDFSGEDPLETGRATHPSILAWRIPWTVQSVGSRRVGHDWGPPLTGVSLTNPAAQLVRRQRCRRSRNGPAAHAVGAEAASSPQRLCGALLFPRVLNFALRLSSREASRALVFPRSVLFPSPRAVCGSRNRWVHFGSTRSSACVVTSVSFNRVTESVGTTPRHFLPGTAVSPLVRSGSLWPHGLQPARLLRPWDAPGKSTGAGCQALLQGSFLPQGSNPSRLQCSRTLPSEPPGRTRGGG